MNWTNIQNGDIIDPAPINQLGQHAVAYHGLRLARQVITTEAVSSIGFDTDSDGNPLNSTFGGELRVYIPEGASTGTATDIIQLRLNNITGDNYWYAGNHAINSMRIGTLAALRAIARSEINLIGGYIQVVSQYASQYVSSGGTNTGSSSYYAGGLTAGGHTAITALNISTSGYTFPAGTVVEWWERG